MKLNRNSWHARYYRWVIDFNADLNRKLPTDGCTYFWSIVGLTILLAIVGTIFSLASVIIGALVGYVPSALVFPIWPEVNDNHGFRQYHKFKLGPMRFYPWHALVALALAWFLYSLTNTYGVGRILTWGSVGIGVILFIVILIAVGTKTRRSESWQLVKEYAKKAKGLCPIIEWTD